MIDAEILAFITAISNAKSVSIIIDSQVSEDSQNAVSNSAIYSFVNSSVATNTAYFRGTFNSVADLEAYSGELTNNDYAFIKRTDIAGNTYYDRYKYNGSAWAFEYALNNSSFTAAQWATIQSGLTAADKTRISTNERKISEIYDTPINHNGIFRGKDLTNVYTIDEMYNMIHSGKFDDLFLGDYFSVMTTTDIYTRFTGDSFVSGTTYYEMGGTLLNREWTETADETPQTGKVYATKKTENMNQHLMFAAFDYYYGEGANSELNTHHAVLIPQSYIAWGDIKMNSAHTTEGAYFNSDMHQIFLPCFAKSFKTALNGHLLTHKSLLSDYMSSGIHSMAGLYMEGSSAEANWYDTELELMSEPQVYGSPIWSSSPLDIGADYKKLPVFDFISPFQYSRMNFWLRSVVSKIYFAYCAYEGKPHYTGAASSINKVRPLMLFG